MVREMDTFLREHLHNVLRSHSSSNGQQSRSASPCLLNPRPLCVETLRHRFHCTTSSSIFGMPMMVFLESVLASGGCLVGIRRLETMAFFAALFQRTLFPGP
ncbi:hypothetical protein CONLIGDRAFT_354219 [Coniochaeta ligniaria NRRL 30616]|uniref:Uncharacterized protein n=1 Tax=Coniochaeta ligniaria NRRL 30616 TaxID=1408157 RepID=A0A1J7J9N0_9PEZI|nr:hypothetical protein CONLIGDRAFT_354219 [Coniochaeta ligniaria NRRL 30616]